MNGENKLDKFQQYMQQNSILVSILFTLQVIIIVLVIFVIKNITSGPSPIPAIPVFSLQSEIKDLPDTSVQPIENMLHDVVVLNNDIVFDVSKSDTKIREGTLVNRYFEEQNIHYVNFIVDIPSLQQSYQIFHEWTDDYSNRNYLINRATMAMCIFEDKMIYPDFECVDNQQNYGQHYIASTFVSYLDFDNFIAFVDQDNLDVIYISPDDVTIDDSTKEAYIKEAKEAIDQLGIPSDQFKYTVLVESDYVYGEK